MGGGLGFLADPLGILNEKDAKTLGDPLGIFGGKSLSVAEMSAAEAAAAAAAAAAANAQRPIPNPFRRPRPTPDTEESLKDDRRRSISQAMRRRAQSSILTSTSTAGSDVLGT